MDDTINKRCGKPLYFLVAFLTCFKKKGSGELMVKTILIQSNGDTKRMIDKISAILNSSEVEITSDRTKPYDLKILIQEFSQKVSEKFGIVSFTNIDEKISKFVEDVGAKETRKYSPLRFGDFYDDIDIVFILGKNENVFIAEDFVKAIKNYAGIKESRTIGKVEKSAEALESKKFNTNHKKKRYIK